MLKVGQIVENYQGRFAKVILIKNGLVWLSAWVPKKADAEGETVAVGRLNSFGLSQVLKGAENAPGKETVEEKAGPKSLSDMKHGELKAYAKELGLSQAGKIDDLVARITEHLQKTVEEEMIDHVVTEEDLEANPELVEEGVQVGDTIKVPKKAE